MLAADADLHVAASLAAFLDRDFHQATDADGIE